MATRTFTAANIQPAAGANLQEGTAGAAITAGQWVAEDASTIVLADADHATAARHTVKGMAVNNAASGQPVKFQVAGDLTTGAASPVMAAGDRFFMSSTAGVMGEDSDLGAGDEVSYVATAVSATVLRIHLHNSGITI